MTRIGQIPAHLSGSTGLCPAKPDNYVEISNFRPRALVSANTLKPASDAAFGAIAPFPPSIPVIGTPLAYIHSESNGSSSNEDARSNRDLEQPRTKQ